jgi:quercetin dioxygenase-like cupin family protein
MTYREYPELIFDGPHVTRYDDALRFAWGDDESGQTLDWIHVSTEEIAQMVFDMPSGSHYGQSDEWKDVYDSDLVWRVLSGSVVILDPDTGEVGRAFAGESFWFQGEMRRYAYSVGAELARVIEFAVPTAIWCERHARQQSRTAHPKFSQDEFLHGWPARMEEQRAASRIRVLRSEDLFWRLDGRENVTLIGLLVSTQRLTVGESRLLPGQRTDEVTHQSPMTMFVQEGSLRVQLPTTGEWLEANAQDGVYLPANTPHWLINADNAPATALFQVVGEYSGGI